MSVWRALPSRLRDLRDLQSAVAEPVNPFDAGGADERAYAPDPNGTPFDPILFEYVDTFCPAPGRGRFQPACDDRTRAEVVAGGGGTATVRRF